MTRVSTHLMFQGDGKDALDLYKSTLPGFVIERIETYEDGEGGAPGTIKTAHVDFNGQRLIVIDSPISHDFDFTPSMSLFVDFTTAEELDDVFATLANGGKVMMPLDDYGFSPRFGWLADRFGVSWQLNLGGV